MAVSPTEIDSCFQLKVSFLPCTVLQILRYDLNHLEQQISTTFKRAPNLFTGSPVLIDLEKIKNINTVNFTQLKQMLLTHHMVLIGVRGGSEEQHAAAIMEGFPVLTNNKSSITTFDTKKTEAYLPAKIISTPVRSGMQVYAQESDLIVTAAVSPGAELLADGNIHVYGVMRGRALAGVQGNKKARIFCHLHDAELISISGYYLTKENMQTTFLPEGLAQIYLEDTQIRIEAI